MNNIESTAEDAKMRRLDLIPYLSFDYCMKLACYLLLGLFITGLLQGQSNSNINPKEALEHLRKGLAGEKNVTPEMVLTLEAYSRNEEPPKDKAKFTELSAVPQEELKARAAKAIEALTEDQVLKMMKTSGQRAAIARGLSGAKQIAIALQMYAADHEKFPAELKDLIKGGYIESEEFFKRLSLISLPDSQVTVEYVPNLSRDNSQAIVLHSSKSIDGKWLVARVDGSCMMLSDEKYAEDMKATNELSKKSQEK